MFAGPNSFLTPPASSLYTVVSGTRAPVFGSTAASPSPPTGYTANVTASADDANFALALPFTFYMAGTGYTTCYPGSNGYVTFGGGSSAYASLGPANPAYPKFFFAGGDYSWQRVSRNRVHYLYGRHHDYHLLCSAFFFQHLVTV